ncbi:MAG: DUF3631 domain-containing protein [Gammaproteobacteria bacterium]
MTDVIENEKLINVREAIVELSRLDKLAYEQVREEKANELKIRVKILDDQVESERKKNNEEASGNTFFPPIKPWDKQVVLSSLLEEIIALLEKYVSFNSDYEPVAIALWVIHTYCIEAAYISPILFITSPEMRSGKSTVLSILQKITFRCIAVSSISPSVLYRAIDKFQPTILCDEADTYMTEKNEDLRCILNAGHSRDTSGVLRTNPDSLEPELFNSFGAKCLAGIKGLPGTVEDRSIIIKMRRLKKGEKKAKLRLVQEEQRKCFADQQSKCLRFAVDNVSSLQMHDPILPDELNSRAADNWHSLFQIAKLAGENWFEITKKAAIYLSGDKQETKSLGIELLEDIQNLFDGKFKDTLDIKTSDLLDALCQDDEGPWQTYNKHRKNQGIDARQLGRFLKPYDISSKNLIRGNERPKGYCKADFQDAFLRYIPSDPVDLAATSATTAPHSNDAGKSANEKMNNPATSRYPNGTQSKIAADSGSERNASNSKISSNSTPNLAGADVAARAEILREPNGNIDYIDV